MHGRKEGWLVGILAAVVFCTGSTGAWSQEFYVPTDPTDQNSQMVSMPVTAPTNRLVSYADDPTLTDLQARIEGLEITQGAAAAAAKKKPTFGGRLYFDYAAFDQNASSIDQVRFNEAAIGNPFNGDMFNGVEARRVRFFMAGNAFNVIDYKVELEFADHFASARDVYGQISELPLLGHVRVGHFKEPFGLEQLTSSRFITFMERSMLENLGGVGDRATGIMAFNWNEAETVSWFVGAFTTLDADSPVLHPPPGFEDEGGTAVDARVTWVPWYDEATEGRGVFHLGAALTYRDINPLIGGGPNYAVSVLPEAHLGKTVATSGLFAADEITAYNLEAAFVYGPLSVQGEYLWMEVEQSVAGAADVDYDGAYISFSYFLTGEHRPYDRRMGCFGRVKPFENFFRVRAEDGNVYTGKGAWEVAYRYSTVDLNDDAIVGPPVTHPGGEVENHTFGVNWYLTPYTRVMLNYINSRTRDHNRPGVGDVDILMTRFQVDF